jgi:hypothetical protein
MSPHLKDNKAIEAEAFADVIKLFGWDYHHNFSFGYILLIPKAFAALIFAC